MSEYEEVAPEVMTLARQVLCAFPHYFEVWELSVVYGIRAEEIAERLGINKSTAYTYKARSKSMVRQAVKRSEQDGKRIEEAILGKDRYTITLETSGGVMDRVDHTLKDALKTVSRSESRTASPPLRTSSLKEARNFAEACQAAAILYRREAERLRKECLKAGLEANTDFWLEAAKDAERAEGVYREEMQEARAKILLRLKQEQLHPFDSAYRTGKYEEILDV